MTARQRWLDAALLLVLAGASLIWGDYLLLFAEPSDKIVRFFGSAEAWHAYVIWWWLTATPSAAAIVLRHRWPLAATFMAAGSAGLHLLDADMPMLPMDLAVLVAMYTLGGSARSRRSVILVLIALEGLLYFAHLAAWFGLTRVGSASDPQKIVDGEPGGWPSNHVLGAYGQICSSRKCSTAVAIRPSASADALQNVTANGSNRLPVLQMSSSSGRAFRTVA